MTDKDKDFVDFHLLLAQAKANIPLMTEWAEVLMQQHTLRAKVIKNYFDELVKAGFTQDHALEIVKTQGWMGK
jgi:hypothetical protein